MLVRLWSGRIVGTSTPSHHFNCVNVSLWHKIMQTSLTVSTTSLQWRRKSIDIAGGGGDILPQKHKPCRGSEEILDSLKCNFLDFQGTSSILENFEGYKEYYTVILHLSLPPPPPPQSLNGFR
jgi:hypothetical protein